MEATWARGWWPRLGLRRRSERDATLSLIAEDPGHSGNLIFEMATVQRNVARPDGVSFGAEGEESAASRPHPFPGTNCAQSRVNAHRGVTRSVDVGFDVPQKEASAAAGRSG